VATGGADKNLYAIIALDDSAYSGSHAVGLGPQRLFLSLRHQKMAAQMNTAEAMYVASPALPRENARVADASVTSIGM